MIMVPQLLQDYLTVDIWEHDGGLWTSRTANISVLDGSFDKPITVIFAQKNTKNANGEDKKPGEKDEKDKCLERRYIPPENFRPILEDDINGSFFCDYHYANDDDDDGDSENNDENHNQNKPTSHTSWATYKAKWVVTEQFYHWIQTTLRVEWDIHNKRLVILFIDVPVRQREYLKRNLPTKRKEQLHPFVWHALFAESVIDLYDKSIWKVRDLVRAIEKKRSIIAQPSNKLSRQHDVARHIYHCTEILEVAENTLSNLVEEHKRFREKYSRMTKLGVLVSTQQKLFFLAKEIHSQRMRCKSLVERINNEVSLAFNLATFSESAVMKTIGIVTMIYLPGTFVSGIFGTNFFDFNAPTEATWTTSDRFWLYWAITVPLTAATLVAWVLWHNLPKWIPLWIPKINGTKFNMREWWRQSESRASQEVELDMMGNPSNQGDESRQEDGNVRRQRDDNV